jgi:hypothetical protein
MAGFSYASNEHLVRTNLWSNRLKETFLDEIFCQKYVDWITDFPDGDTLNIPSIGQMETQDYVENQQIRYTSMDTGNFTFTIDQYKSSATYITERMKQDSFYMSRLVASFVPKQHRALMKALEVKILDVGPSAQTLASTNAINGASHRWVGQGTNEIITPQDFAKANFALDMANVPHSGRIAIVHPSAGYALETMTNLVNVSNNPRWEGIITTGLSTGLQFVRNIYGFDVYVSQNLKVNAASETISGVTAAAGVNNIFFSAAPDAIPLIGLIRQPPKVDSEYVKDLQREEYVTTMRYGVKLFRPENFVVVVTDTDQV